MTRWRRAAATASLVLAGSLGVPAASSAAPALPSDTSTADPTTAHEYQVEVEGLVRSDLAAFERRVAEILGDPRGWSLGGTLRFEQVEEAATTIVLASPQAVDAADEGCSAEFSCRVGDRVLINERNWREMTPAWRAAGGDLRTYREYLINHEVGHLLGFEHHDCPGPGAPAPVMQQQSVDLDGCVPAGWPEETERRALAELAGLPPEAAEVAERDEDRHGHDDGVLGEPGDQVAREVRDRLVAQRVLAVKTRQMADPVVELVETGWSVLLGRREPSGPLDPQVRVPAEADRAWDHPASAGLATPSPQE